MSDIMTKEVTSTEEPSTTPPPLLNPPSRLAVEGLVTEDDTPLDNLFSEKQQRLLTEPLYSSWPGPVGEAGERRPFLAAANVGLFSSLHQPPLVPDMFLSLDVTAPPNLWEKSHRSYFFWEYGKAPDVAIEVVSNRKGNEAGSKLKDYARLGIPYYVIYDPGRQLGETVLRVYELHVGKYQARTDYALPGVGLSLQLWEGTYEGVTDTWLRWCDGGSRLVPTGAERAVRLAAKLRELGVDPDQLV